MIEKNKDTSEKKYVMYQSQIIVKHYYLI